MPGSDHDRGENFTMAEAVCYAPSELARSINQLPFPGFGAAVGNLLGDGVVSAVLGNSISVSSPDSFCQIQTTISDLSAPHIPCMRIIPVSYPVSSACVSCLLPVLRKIEHIDTGFMHALVESNLQVYKVILQFRMFVAILLLLKYGALHIILSNMDCAMNGFMHFVTCSISCTLFYA